MNPPETLLIVHPQGELWLLHPSCFVQLEAV